METKNGASENWETKQNQPHNHHFIPQFYLRHFATKDTREMNKKAQKIYVIDKSQPCFECKPRFIKHVGSKDYYNTLWIDENHEDHSSIERFLRNIEKSQAKMLDRIKTEKSIINIPKRELAGFVAWMHCRVPFQKKVCEEIQEYNRLLEARATQCVLPFIPIDATHSYDNGASLKIMYNEPQKKQFLDVLETFRYALMKIPKDSKKFFITSDNPVAFIGKGTELQARYFVYRFDTDKEYSSVDEDGKIMTYREQGSFILPNYADFEKKSFDLFLPIDPKLGLWLHDNKRLPDQILLLLPDKDVCFFWHHTISSADEKIYTSEITDELQTFMGNGIFFKNTIEVRRARESRAYDYFMKYVCGIEDNYTCEDFVREMKNKKYWDVACVNITVPGSHGGTKFCVVNLKEDVSTHWLALSEGNRPHWAQKLKTNKLIVLFAPLQTNGVGSHGRKWVSDREDFHVNLIFYADKILPFSQIAAYTACQLLARETYQPEYFRIRWPNDVMVLHWSRGLRNFKIGGCLTAVRKEEARYWVTVGVGINYNLEDFSNIDQPTVSVKSFLNSFGKNCKLLYRENDFTRDELFQSVQRFAELFLKNLAFIRQKGLAAFYDEEDPLDQFGSKNYWLYLGQKVTVFDEDKKKQLTGRFDKLTDDGALQLACDNGKTEIVLNGTGLKLA